MPVQHETSTQPSRHLDSLPALAAIVVSACTLAVAFGALALDSSWFWVAFPVGFGGVLPLAVGAAQYWVEATDGDEVSGDTADDPLSILHAQYVDGELSEEEFERRVERVLESDADGEELA